MLRIACGFGLVEPGVCGLPFPFIRNADTGSRGIEAPDVRQGASLVGYGGHTNRALLRAAAYFPNFSQ